ncbi:cytochrome-c peroxidase [Methylocaldum sp. 14B]|uniref:cytochrome-c peroxidase n=1 Tax=unclassified Methylocaldum TaxID=2622260 RepID=UPI00098B3B92|nr:cytochrome-c peroxidase [Methylocaldum sp. 14B]
MKRLILCLPLMVVGNAWAAEELMQRAQALFKPIPTEPPPIRNTVVTPERIELGKMLYFDPRLSRSWMISCNSCHNLALGGVDLEQTSIGHGWQKGPRNAPTVLNSVFNIAQFWDGRAADLQTQAKGPLQASVEMNNTPERLEKTLNTIPGYVERFKQAFPNEPNPVSFDNLAKAIEAFEATLITPNSKFDRYLKGDDKALNDAEKQGLALFMDKGCSNCHNGINIGGNGYFPFGVVEKPGAEILPLKDKGRFTVTNTASDEYVFKVPSLRNIVLTPPYFHSGQVWDLRQAVAIMGTAQLGAKLTDPEIDSVTTFLRTLTGDQPKIELTHLPAHTKDTPLPIVEVTPEGTVKPEGTKTH